MTVRTLACFLLAFLITTAATGGQSVRSRTRPKTDGTAVSESQASDLTLTLSRVAVRPIQVWVRAAGTLDSTRRIIRVQLTRADGTAVKPGQRARAFAIQARSSMFQAFVSRVVPEGKHVTAEITLAAKASESGKYVVEIVTDRGDFLSIPNEAIIEEGRARIVYVEHESGHYQPQEIATGLQGELYTEITGGLRDGAQVVTFGSFFIDSEFKLKGSAQGAAAAPQGSR
jgi:hypothetical protein